MRAETGAKRVRAFLGGRAVADTRRPLLVWDRRSYPAYWLPEKDVDLDAVPEAALSWPPADAGALAGHVHLAWEALDAWFEEDEEVYVHPRDPYSRVDILASSRHVVVRVGGEVVAESGKPTLLFETDLPARYYLPRTHVRMDLLRPSATTSACPYKGTAVYWTVEAGGATCPDLAWTYRTPVAESMKIAGLVCFYNEKVDLVVDGELLERPHTHFS
ncbi:MAG: DUF427 domain-containing protein [Acidimicrobiia bacterium]